MNGWQSDFSWVPKLKHLGTTGLGCYSRWLQKWLKEWFDATPKRVCQKANIQNISEFNSFESNSLRTHLLLCCVWQQWRYALTTILTGTIKHTHTPFPEMKTEIGPNPLQLLIWMTASSIRCLCQNLLGTQMKELLVALIPPTPIIISLPRVLSSHHHLSALLGNHLGLYRIASDTFFI